MWNKIKQYIESNNLLDKQAKHLVALSGGADSVCLMLVLQKLGYDIEAAHCNFYLRGEESIRDEHFCESLCKRCGVTLHITHFDTIEYARKHKHSIETAARNLRYEYFEELRRDIRADDVCVAHHKDDNVETVIMNMVRGTGLNGIIGIRPVNGCIKRPLLCVTRKEITDYLHAIGQDYVVDSTNLIDDTTRNKIRLDIVPLLEEINPAAKENICRMTELIADAEHILKQTIIDKLSAITRQQDGYTVIDSLNNVFDSASISYAVFYLLQPLGFNAEQMREIASSDKHGAKWQSNSHTVVIERGNILIAPNDYDVKQPQIEYGVVPVDSHFNPSLEKYFATLDGDKVVMPLTVRKVEKGDKFVPYGMKGSKLVSDYLTDKKRNFFERQCQYVVCDADGNIVWLVGERTDNRFAVTENTINALQIRYYNNE